MDRIVGYQLQRASTSGHSGLAAPQPVRPAVERLLVALAKVYAGKSIATEVVADAHVRFRGDEGDLTELLGNLLDNAFKWARARVVITAASSEDRLTLTSRTTARASRRSRRSMCWSAERGQTSRCRVKVSASRSCATSSMPTKASCVSNAAAWVERA